MKKNILLSLSTIITVGVVCGITLPLTSSNDFKTINEKNTNNNLEINPNGTSATTLTPYDVNELGWHKKSSITLSDWAKFAPNVTIIGDLAFYLNDFLVYIEIPSSIVEIDSTSFAFTNVLRTIVFEENSNLVIIGSAAFSHSAITSINIPYSVEAILSSAFISTKSLKKITFDTNSNLKLIDSYAFTASSIETITLPDKDFSLDDNAFENTIFLKNVVAKYSLKKNSKTSKYGFSQNQWDNINWIYSPTNSTTITLDVLESIGWDKKSIIKLMDWSTMAPMVIQIEDGFMNHSLLEEIELPKKILLIDSNGFSGCNNLKRAKMSIYFKRTEPSFGLSYIQWADIQWISPGTFLVGGDFEISEGTEILASDFGENYIKKIIIGELLKYAPSNLVDSNIILENLVANNLIGKISLSASINKYYDDNLVEQTNNFTPVDLTFFGFKKIIPTSIIEQEYTIDDKFESIGNDYTDNEIIDFLKSKVIGDIPDDFEIKIVKRLTNSDGKIIIELEMINYFNSDGMINDSSSPILTLTLTGFGVIKSSNSIILIITLSISAILLVVIGFGIYKFVKNEKNKKSREIIMWEE
ncbi:MAG: leucine-rich repeat protein [Mycoplasmataceae bacterium]|nr:leucine-rich repeat protein [Mycoplasmataceae bacterium]